MRKLIFINICIATFFSLIIAIALLIIFYFIGFLNLFAIISLLVIFPLSVAVNYKLSEKLTTKIINHVGNDLGSVYDITSYEELTYIVTSTSEQQKRFSELTDKTESINTIFENMQDGFILLDSFANVFMINNIAKNILQVEEDCIGKNISELSNNPTFLHKVKAALQGHGGQMFIEFTKFYNVLFTPSPDKGLGIVISDATEKQLADKISKEFTANVSHELSAPLTMLIGFADLIKEGKMTAEDTAHFAEKIKVECQRMQDMIKDIAILSEMDELGVSNPFVRFDVAKLAAEAINDLTAEAEKSEISISLSSSLCAISGNRQLIYLLLSNLISNAIRYSNPKDTVRVAVSMNNGNAYINVTDTGIGLSKEEQHRIFDRFYRTSYSNNLDKVGTGLGLSIVRQIVRVHNGTIDIESAVGEGTRAFVKIPQEPKL